MSSDDDFDKLREHSKKNENSLMKKMVVFSVGLLVITGIAYYLIEIRDWDMPIELTDIGFFSNEDGWIECDSVEHCKSKCAEKTYYHEKTNSCEIYPEANEIVIDMTNPVKLVIKDEYWQPEPEYVLQCELWIEESGKMVDANEGIKDITLWTQEDREKILQIEENYVTNCIPTSDDVLFNLPRCTVHYITIQRIISEMESKEGTSGFDLHSIPEWKQDDYLENYRDYYGLHCDKLKDAIYQQPMFKEYNATRQ